MRRHSVILFVGKERSLFPSGIPIWKRTLAILFILPALPVLGRLKSLFFVVLTKEYNHFRNSSSAEKATQGIGNEPYDYVLFLANESTSVLRRERKMMFDSFILFASKKRDLFPNEIPIWKRTLDIFFIAVLPVVVPLISLIALGIRCSIVRRAALGEKASTFSLGVPIVKSGSSRFTQGRNQFILQGDKEVDHDSRTEAGFRTEQCGSGAAVI